MWNKYTTNKRKENVKSAQFQTTHSTKFSFVTLLIISLFSISAGQLVFLLQPAEAKNGAEVNPASIVAKAPARNDLIAVDATASYYNQATDTNVREINLLGDEQEQSQQEIRLNGLFDRRDLTLTVPPGWVLTSDSYIALNVSHSPLLLPQTSSLTIYLNNRPVSSLRLEETNQQDFTWQVPLPKNFQPDKGQLQFSFAASMRTEDAYCPTTDGSSSWLKLTTPSLVHLEYKVQAPSSLAELPQTFFGSKSIADRNLVIVVPPTPTKRDLARASQLLTRLGGLAGVEGLAVSLSYGTPPASSDGKSVNQIFLGGPTIFPLLANLKLQIPLNGQAFSEKEQALGPEIGVLQLANSAANDKSLSLVVSGGSEEAVDRAVQALLDDRSLSLMPGPYSLVQANSQFIPAPVPARPSKTSILNGRNTFTNLGLDTQTIFGQGTRDNYYSFSIPVSSTISGDGQLSLDYSYSNVIDSRRSSLTVILNGVWLQGIGLAGSNSTDAALFAPTTVPTTTVAPAPTSPTATTLKPSHVNLILPKDVLRNGENYLILRFGLFLVPRCSETNFNDIWGTTYRTSELNIPTTAATPKAPTLDQLPYPFAGNTRGTLIVLPDAPDAANLKVAAQLTAELGRNDFTNQFNRISIVEAKQVEREQLNQNNVILLGTPATNSWMKEANPKLPVVWDSSNGRTLTTQRGLRFASSDTGLKALVQVAPSPWNNQLALLSVLSEAASSAGDNGSKLSTMLGRNLYVKKYTGIVMTLDNKNKVRTFSTLDQSAEEEEPTPVATQAASAPGAAGTPGSSGSPSAGNTQAASASPVAISTSGSTNNPASRTTTSTTSDNSGISPLVVAIAALLILGLIGGAIFLARRPTRSNPTVED